MSRVGQCGPSTCAPCHSVTQEEDYVCPQKAESIGLRMKFAVIVQDLGIQVRMTDPG